VPVLPPTTPRIAVIGGGPAGLMAAERLAAAGLRVTVYEQMPSVGRKFLLAGRSGLNLTHAEPLDRFVTRYGEGAGADLVAAAVRAFPPDELRAWAEGLGEPTFVGSSGRVFPESFRATPLLRAWLRRLAELGVAIRPRHRWQGWATTAEGTPDPRRLLVTGPDGEEVVECEAAVFALGGASWPRVGSDGHWVDRFRAAGVQVATLEPSNCGVEVPWSAHLRDRAEGQPLKNVAVRVAGAAGDAVRGDLMITARGLEGGPVYTWSREVRAALAAEGRATLLIDLHPDLGPGRLAARLATRRAKESAATALRRAGLSPVAITLLREVVPDLPAEPTALADLVHAVPLTVERTMPLDRAISSAGGVLAEELDEHFMLRSLPGTFVVGEMLDGEAPTGGYLLQAAFATAVAAAEGVQGWLEADRWVEVEHDETRWRFDRRFLGSNWTCLWGRGCLGIGPEPAPELGLGCCSLGAELDGLDEARTVAALAATLPPERFQFHAEAAAGGVFADETATNTRVIDGGCIFANRPGFAGGAGCALHLGALADGESPIDWKPSVCWQLPIKVDWEPADDGWEVATVRGWERRDWGEDGPGMAWCCTEGPEAYVGERPVIDSLAEELSEVVGSEVFVELRRRW
jgi:uncharacterized flavoprotein (TIGR03862 family)